MKLSPLLPRLAPLLIICCTVLTFSAQADTSFDDRMQQAEKAVMAKRSAGKEAFYTELEKQARALLKDFPERKEPYEMLLAVANTAEGDQSKKLLAELTGDKVPEEVREQANGILSRMDAVGKPVDIKVKSIDGRDIDLTAMKGKVVLVDFWATWCGPCVQEIPNLLATYEKLNGKGFEIVGISLDREKSALENFVKAKKLPWPQYLDDPKSKDSLAQKYGINAIPTMWLINKQGNLVDMNAREDLAGKVEKLLAE